MHKFSTAVTKSSGVLHRLCDPQAGVPPTRKRVPPASSTYRTVRLRGPTRKRVPSRVAQRTQVSASLRDKNLCIIRVKGQESIED